MKVLAFVVITLGAVAAKGSGPYLPSGWRPTGPAFYLPSEVKPSDNPLKDLILQGSETEGSDSLLEYGPPKVQEVSQELPLQGLPDAVIDQIFVNVIDQGEVRAIVDDVKADIVVDSEVNSEIASRDNTPEAVTESQVTEEITTQLVSNEQGTLEQISEITTIFTNEGITEVQTTEATVEDVNLVTNAQINIEESVQNTQNIAEVQSTEVSGVENSQKAESAYEITQSESTEIKTGVTDAFSEIKSFDIKEESQTSTDLVATVEQNEEAIEQIIEEEVKQIEQVVQNIPLLLIDLEKDIENKQVENIQDAGVTSVQEVSGALEQVPEGFLEYGPPGFAEYGPPKDDLTSARVQSAEQDVIDSNQARRRRFSPKFRSTKMIH